MLIMSVDIINLGSGNVRSIYNILSSLNVYSRLVDKPEDIQSQVLILPGVGSAKPYMQKLQASGFDRAIKGHVASGKKIIGICLGFQLMTQFSEEDGDVDCLGVIPGRVTRLMYDNQSSNHNGWTPFSIKREMLNAASYAPLHKLTRKQIVRGRVFYNHEYGVVLDANQSQSIGINHAHYNHYTAMYISENIIGMQFHPEKSQITGSELLSLIL